MRSEGDRICWVVKVGSSLLADQGVGLNEDAISDLVAQVAALRLTHGAGRPPRAEGGWWCCLRQC